MKNNWKFAALVFMFALQLVFGLAQDRLFKEGMERKREWILQDLATREVTAKQASAFASVMRETEYEVSSYVRNVVGGSLILNFGMIVVAASHRRKDVG